MRGILLAKLFTPRCSHHRLASKLVVVYYLLLLLCTQVINTACHFLSRSRAPFVSSMEMSDYQYYTRIVVTFYLSIMQIQSQL
jgi:hypothetical protein